MQVFYSTNIKSQEITLSEEESIHAIKVLRMKKNDSLIITNGSGMAYLATLIHIEKNQCVVSLNSPLSVAATTNNISVALALLKNQERIEWFIEKSCELGAHRILLFQSERSERDKIKDTRLRKKIVESCKQAHNYHFPELIIYDDLDQVIKHENHEEKYIAHCLANDKNRISSFHQESSIVLIGPEGDFTAEEIDIAESAGYKSITLGHLTLRAETAAIVALMLLKNKKHYLSL